MPVKSLQQWLGNLFSDLPDIAVHELQLDSRKVQAGDVFLALPGVQQHGNLYIEQALNNGAVLVLTNEGVWNDNRIRVLTDLPEQLPALAAAFYQHPQQHLQLAAVTGTNGKSSTAFFISQLAEQLGQHSGVIGTLGYGHYQALTPLPNTTPHYIDIQRILAEFVSEGRSVAAMEVSSHALAQQRVNGLQFQVAVFTNLTRDHLDYHGSMQEYAAVKGLLFTPELSRAAVINVSDEFGKQLAARTAVPVWVYGKAEDCTGYPRYLGYQQVIPTAEGYHCLLTSQFGEHELTLPLLGEFNIQNVLAAVSSMLVLGYDLPSLLAAVQQLKAVPGRMETFRFPGESVAVVDYAHTPDALQQALKALRLHCHGHLWCVFGCGGDRDKGKRPVMGQIAEQYADHVIITSDNPRSEDLMQICHDIALGMSPDAPYQIEPDRRAAIKLALASAQSGDLILIAGKGHETVQIIGSEQRSYDERAFVQQLIREMTV
ncbi:UDP-N-acetylmuramoyl-L-alanyl-D-glutamate--2,6-diaminopimelate ligase [Chromatiaceae bacterium AAb-1]|nr:UDP-N-acetylmuramoyl-L-alanyl-D-glutamate--2,6-diaminopimelate ligase [Chromatiaceae bacterium AAb-1]